MFFASRVAFSMYMKRTYFFNTFKYNFSMLKQGSFFYGGHFSSCITSKILLFFLQLGGHFSTSKNDPWSLFCDCHYSSLHRFTFASSPFYIRTYFFNTFKYNFSMLRQGSFFYEGHFSSCITRKNLP